MEQLRFLMMFYPIKFYQSQPFKNVPIILKCISSILPGQLPKVHQVMSFIFLMAYLRFLQAMNWQVLQNLLRLFPAEMDGQGVFRLKPGKHILFGYMLICTKIRGTATTSRQYHLQIKQWFGENRLFFIYTVSFSTFALY